MVVELSSMRFLWWSKDIICKVLVHNKHTIKVGFIITVIIIIVVIIIKMSCKRFGFDKNSPQNEDVYSGIISNGVEICKVGAHHDINN